MDDIKSSLSELDFFIGSHVYEDFQDELEICLEEVRKNQDGTDDEKELWRCQGRVDVIERLKDWAEVTRDSIEEGINE